MIEPLYFNVQVACSAEDAFAAWTERASAWWPREHTMGQHEVAAIVFEPCVGGRIFERTRSGQENEWGKITVWDPPRRLAYLWRIATDESNATDVEIRFVEVAPSITRVEIEHRGWENLGAERGPAWRDQNRDGWTGVLPDYIAACAATVPTSTGRR